MTYFGLCLEAKWDAISRHLHFQLLGREQLTDTPKVKTFGLFGDRAEGFKDELLQAVKEGRYVAFNSIGPLWTEVEAHIAPIWRVKHNGLTFVRFVGGKAKVKF